MWAISVATIGPSRSAAPSFSNRDACRSQTASLRHCSHISTLARRPARRLRLTRHFSGIGRQPGDIRAEWPKVCCAACYGARNSNPLLGVWGPEFMTFVMPSSSTGCSPGIGKASIHSLISLTWQPTSATRTSTRPWCISPLLRNCCSKPASDSVCGEPRSCELRQTEETHEAHSLSPPSARLLSRLVGATAKRLPSHRAVLPGQLAVVSPVCSCRKEEIRSQARSERSQRGRGSRVSRKHRACPQVLDWNPELPIRGIAQLLQFRGGPRAFAGCALRRCAAYSYQTST